MTKINLIFRIYLIHMNYLQCKVPKQHLILPLHALCQHMFQLSKDFFMICECVCIRTAYVGGLTSCKNIDPDMWIERISNRATDLMSDLSRSRYVKTRLWWMGHSMTKGNQKWIQNFGRKISREEITLEVKAHMWEVNGEWMLEK